MLHTKRLLVPLYLSLALPLSGHAASEAGQEAPPATTPETVQPAPAPDAQPAQPEIALEYQIQGGAMQNLGGLDEDPLTPWLTILKQSIAAAREQKQAVTTSVRVIGDAEAEPVLGALPPVMIRTESAADGKGSAVITHEAVKQHKIREGANKGTLDWQGVQGKVTFSGDLEQPRLDFAAPGLDIKIDNATEDDRVSFNFKDLSLKAAFDAANEPLNLDFQLPQLNLSADDGHIKLNALSATLDLKEAMPGLKIGGGSLKLSSLHFDDKNGSYHLDGAAAAISSTLRDKQVDYNLKMQVDKLQAQNLVDADEPFSFHAVLGVNNLGAQALAELSNTARQLQKQGMSEDMIGVALLGKFFELLPALTANSPEIALSDLNLKAAGGSLQGQVKLQLDGAQPLNFQDLAGMTKALSGAADLSISKALLEAMFRAQIKQQQGGTLSDDPEQQAAVQQMIDAQIQGLVQQNMLSAGDGDTYKLTASLKAGKFLLNGQEMPLPVPGL